jgi:dihydrolipoamide dehydrogenase
MSTDSTDVAVIGGGPGGYAAAFYAADLGKQVTLIDSEPNPGGVCLYRGCIPSKALLHAAAVIDTSRRAAAMGIEFGEPRVALDKLRAWKDSVVQRLTRGLGQICRQRAVRFVQGHASLLDARTLSVTTAAGAVQRIAFAHAILATGSRPATVPGLSVDGSRVMDSTGALELPDVPDRLLVVGGGYIGLEIGTVYAALGARVTVVEMTAGLLPGVDRDLVAIVARRLEKVFEAIRLDTKVVDINDEATGVRARFEGPDAAWAEGEFDKVLVAAGRRPDSSIPGLDRTRVEVDARGFIKVDAQRRTAEPTLFAVGDVAGEPMLAHKASCEARVAVDAIAGRASVFEPRAMPAVVFTDPEVAWCGLTEAQARKEGRPVEIARFPWGASGRAITLDRPEGVTKLVLDPETERVLGVGIAGAGAGELIAEGVLAVEMGACAADLTLIIHPHPTLSETLMEAAEVFFGQSSHFHRPKKNAGL